MALTIPQRSAMYRPVPPADMRAEIRGDCCAQSTLLTPSKQTQLNNRSMNGVRSVSNILNIRVLSRVVALKRTAIDEQAFSVVPKELVTGTGHTILRAVVDEFHE